jgi:hypothetical protein
MGIQIEFSLYEELDLWGKWASSCTPNSEAGSYKIQPFVVKKGGSQFEIPESRLIEIDQAIAKLFVKDEQLINAFKWFYIAQVGYRTIAIRLPLKANGKRWNKDSVKQWMDMATAQLEGYFIAKREAA